MSGREGEPGDVRGDGRSAAVEFLQALARCLSAAGLYGSDHPSRQAPLREAGEALERLLAARPRTALSFLPGEVVLDDEPLGDLAGWPWAGTLAEAGVQRIVLSRGADRRELEAFLRELARRLGRTGVGDRVDGAEDEVDAVDGAAPSGTARDPEIREHPASAGSGASPGTDHPHIRFGTLGLRDESGEPADRGAGPGTHRLTLEEEAEAVSWLHDRADERGWVPIAEALSVVRSLALALRHARRIVLPLLGLRPGNGYTAAHCLRVSLLSMRLARETGRSAEEVHQIGLAGLLHDVGKVRIPGELLVRTGTFTPEERAVMERHPAEGCRILLDSPGTTGLAAAVAYEHHLSAEGTGGYPSLRWPRSPLPETRLVQVCNYWDARRTDRPHRPARSPSRIRAMMERRAGRQLDAGAVGAFLALLEHWDPDRILADAEGSGRAGAEATGTPEGPP